MVPQHITGLCESLDDCLVGRRVVHVAAGLHCYLSQHQRFHFCSETFHSLFFVSVGSASCMEALACGFRGLDLGTKVMQRDRSTSRGCARVSTTAWSGVVHVAAGCHLSISSSSVLLSSLELSDT